MGFCSCGNFYISSKDKDCCDICALKAEHTLEIIPLQDKE